MINDSVVQCNPGRWSGKVMLDILGQAPCITIWAIYYTHSPWGNLP